ncbi:hypothetical protein HDV06_002456 [Boothiomyces sp. JEL0866]|nr:hypothetical protein HDV06_002456 [Boothiomyces sp. JEL0866]
MISTLLFSLVHANNLTWTTCGDNLQCSSILVPLDHSNQDSRKVQIPLIKFLSKGPSKGSVLFNPGGPGNSGVEALQQFGPFISQLVGGEFDVVGFDPRGTGKALPVICSNNSNVEFQGIFDQGVLFLPNKPSKTQLSKFSAYSELIGTRCQTMNNDTLGFMSTPNTARDMDLIRQALDMELMNYIGISYGSFLGNVYSNLFPDKVGKIALDGILNPDFYTGDALNFLDGLKDSDKALGQFFAQCDHSLNCPLKQQGKSTKDLTFQLLSQLEETPLFTDTLPPVLYTSAMFESALFSTMPTPSAWPVLASGIAQALQGNATVLLSIGFSELVTDKCGVTSSLLGLAPGGAAIACADTADSTRKHSLEEWESIIATKSRFSKITVKQIGWRLLPCRTWPFFKTQERYTGPFNNKFANTVLLFGNTVDPATPLSSAQSVLNVMNSNNPQNAVLVQNNATGHTTFNAPNACTIKTYQMFFNGTIPPKGTICQPDSPIFK